MVKKHTILTMATSQKPKFEDVSSVLYFAMFVAQCISQNIKKHKKIEKTHNNNIKNIKTLRHPQKSFECILLESRRGQNPILFDHGQD